MDELDHDIIRILKRDGRAPYTAIADMVDASEATIRARIKRMHENGTIQGFTVRVRGAAVRALVEVSIETNVETGKVSSQVVELPGVQEVWEVTGEYDIALIADVDSTEQLNELVESVRRVSETRSTRTRVILNELY